MWVRMAAMLVVVACLVACSGGGTQTDSDGGSRGNGTGGANDGGIPPAQAAVQSSVSTVGSAPSCGATRRTATVPTGNASLVWDELGCNVATGCKPDRIVLLDGDPDASVSCIVASAGSDQFHLALLVQEGTLRFEVQGTIGPTGGTVTINEFFAGKSVNDSNCTLSIVKNAQGAFGIVKEGAVWAHFSCPNLTVPGDVGGGVCSGEGAFLFENCGR